MVQTLLLDEAYTPEGTSRFVFGATVDNRFSYDFTHIDQLQITFDKAIEGVFSKDGRTDLSSNFAELIVGENRVPLDKVYASRTPSGQGYLDVRPMPSLGTSLIRAQGPTKILFVIEAKGPHRKSITDLYVVPQVDPKHQISVTVYDRQGRGSLFAIHPRQSSIPVIKVRDVPDSLTEYMETVSSTLGDDAPVRGETLGGWGETTGKSVDSKDFDPPPAPDFEEPDILNLDKIPERTEERSTYEERPPAQVARETDQKVDNAWIWWCFVLTIVFLILLILVFMW